MTTRPSQRLADSNRGQGDTALSLALNRRSTQRLRLPVRVRARSCDPRMKESAKTRPEVWSGSASNREGSECSVTTINASSQSSFALRSLSTRSKTRNSLPLIITADESASRAASCLRPNEEPNVNESSFHRRCHRDPIALNACGTSADPRSSGVRFRENDQAITVRDIGRRNLILSRRRLRDLPDSR